MSDEKPLPPMPPVRGRHREAWVGAFVVAGLAAVLLTLALLTDAALFRGRYIVATNVPNAGGIRKGDPVLMRGVNIGRVVGFAISQSGVRLRLEIEGEYQIPADSRIELKAQGLLGGMVAEVILGSSARMAKWGDELQGTTAAGLFDKVDELAGEADKVAVQVQNLLSQQTVKDLQGGAADARQALGQLQAVLKEQRGELRALTRSLRRSAEGVEKVVDGPELERSVARIDSLTARLDGTLTTLDRSSGSLDSILARLERGEGTAGKLLRDDQLYRNASDAAASIDKAAKEFHKLAVDFRAHPRKYINLEIF